MAKPRRSTAASHGAAEDPRPIRPTRSHDEPPVHSEEEIRLRAYELYEQRGRRDGFAEEDWLDAEKEILARYGKIAA